jgi:F-type H+-transporting ATPase subunit b
VPGTDDFTRIREPTEFVMVSVIVLLSDASGGGGQIQEIARTFGVDWPHLAAQMISFGVVCVLLHRFAYRPVLGVLAERRQRIAEGLANAEQIKAELAKTKAQQHEMMVEAGAQATRVVEEARAAAARVGERETQKALAAAEEILARAREAAGRDHDRMLLELRREVGRLVVRTTAAVIGKVLTPEDERRLALETTEALDAEAAAVSGDGRRRAAEEAAGKLLADGELGVRVNEAQQENPAQR